MSTVSRESKVLLFASFVLAFVGVPTVATPNMSHEHLYIAIGGSLGLMILAAIFFIVGLVRLQKEGAIYFPSKPKIPAPAVLLFTIAGVLISFFIIDSAGLLANIALTFWVFLLCASIGSFIGLYIAGLRIGKKS